MKFRPGIKSRVRAGLWPGFYLLLILHSGLYDGCNPRPAAPVRLRVTPRQLSLFQGERVDLGIRIWNRTGRGIVPGEGYFFSYHVYDRAGQEVSFDNRRFALPRPVGPGKRVEMQIPVFFPLSVPGRYQVEFDLVKEGEYWGSQRGWQVPRIPLELKPLFSENFRQRYLRVWTDTGHRLLNREQYLLRLTLKNSEIRRRGKLVGFSAGSHYPAVWIRDTASFISLALDHYPCDLVQEMVELFLDHQKSTGEVVDWVNPGGETGKNTIESDQESALVLAAHEIWRRNPEWTGKQIGGRSVLQRLEMALSWLYRHRLNPRYGLLESGFTADFGDVGKDQPDQRALQLTEDTTRVLGIYTQARYLRAVDALSAMLEDRFPRLPDRLTTWRKRRESLAARTRELLYLPRQGYYLIHLVPDQPRYLELERDMLAVAGNAEAILAGLMTPEEIEIFIRELLLRKEQFRLRTVGFNLIPPYPQGFFRHHLMRRPWHYQNGGEWDWIGGRLVEALFARGFQREAEAFLLEIAAKNIRDLNINEWQDRRGIPRGADHYTGAAGEIARAIQAGYGGDRRRLPTPEPGRFMGIEGQLDDSGKYYPGQVLHDLGSDVAGMIVGRVVYRVIRSSSPGKER